MCCGSRSGRTCDVTDGKAPVSEKPGPSRPLIPLLGTHPREPAARKQRLTLEATGRNTPFRSNNAASVILSGERFRPPQGRNPREGSVLQRKMTTGKRSRLHLNNRTDPLRGVLPCDGKTLIPFRMTGRVWNGVKAAWFLPLKSDAKRIASKNSTFFRCFPLSAR